MKKILNIIIVLNIILLFTPSVLVWGEEECPNCQKNDDLNLTSHFEAGTTAMSRHSINTMDAVTIGDASVTMTCVKSFKQEKNQWSAPLPLDSPMSYTHDSKLLFRLESIRHTNGLATESWTVQFIFPDGREYMYLSIKWYESYQGKSNCFVWGTQLIAEETTELSWLEGWIEDTRCMPSGILKLNLIHDSVIIGTVDWIIRPGCDRDSIVSGSMFNQGTYNDRNNELHHLDNACRNKVKESSHFCNKTLYPNEFNTTISMSGCAMTSCCVMLNFYGIQVTPTELNTWLKENDGYVPVGNIDWAKVAQYARKHNVNLIHKREITESQLESYLCKYGPQIAGVKNNGHWVCIYGKDTDGNWVILDPSGGTKMKLTSKYTKINSIRGFYLSEISYTPLPGLTIILRSPAEILVTDSHGRRTGYDPLTGQSYNEIPEAIYCEEGYDDDETGGEIEHRNKILYMDDISADT